MNPNELMLMPFDPFTKGLVVMSSLIIAIGPQNAFVIRQSLSRDRAFQVSAICLFGDILMVTIGALGLGQFISSLPKLNIVVDVIASLYMFAFALRSARNALTRTHFVLKADNVHSVLLTAVALTFLNPHTVMDTMFIVGTIASMLSAPADKWLFVFGAISASAVWFFGLALLGHSLARPLSRPQVWKIIDLAVAAMMCVFGAMLLTHVFLVFREIVVH
jgi:L-lysine exporter family protein LysE/ArgO